MYNNIPFLIKLYHLFIKCDKRDKMTKEVLYMQRYFIEEQIHNQTTLTISKEDLYHIKKVMRGKKGDTIICIDTCGINYQCSIIDIETGLVHIDSLLPNDSELDVDVTLVYAMPKGDKFEFVLQKATELGVKQIVPLFSNRCVVKLDYNKFEKKKQRYQKIVKEASEQSYRNFIPKIEDSITMQDLSKYVGDINIVAYEETAKLGQHDNLYKGLKKVLPGQKITVIVGAEGGFDKEEIEQMEAIGFMRCSLGKRILRSETAPLYILSVIGFNREVQK